MWILIAFIAFFVLVGVVYIVLTLLVIPGLAEERLGKLEPLPADAEQWKTDPDGETPGVQRETRLWIDRDMLGRQRITRQIRYVDEHTGEVVATEPDQRVRRRRIKP